MLPQFRRIIRSNDLFADVFRTREIQKKKVVIDFSSPNVAKTFHMGNLRSTLYGNFIQKLYRSAGHDVHSINYLGDWGTQFAKLALYWGLMDRLDIKRPNETEWKSEWDAKRKVDFLTKCYADANAHIKSNPALEERARQLFAGMEKSVCSNFEAVSPQAADENTSEQVVTADDVNKALELWHEWRQLSVDYLRDFYRNFGVTHSEWSYESEQVDSAHIFTRRLIDEGIAFFTADKLWAIRDNYISGKVVLRKSDGSSLYLSRDLAAIFERDARLAADEYMYVVDRAQYTHFAHLKSLVDALGKKELSAKIMHISYGRIIGLSTRLGKNDSVDYLINEGGKEARRYILKSPTTRLDPNSEETAAVCEKLARSVIVFDLMKRHRATEYTFSFKGAFNINDNNALLLNTKYSRLCSMEKVNHELMARLTELSKDESISFGRLSLELNSPPAQKLARFIHEFETIVVSSYDALEPCILTNYLLQLSHQIGRTMAELRVRGEIESVALPRLFLFMAAKRILGDGMKMLGIEPVEEL